MAHEPSLEEKCADAKRILQTWMDEQGHERCWYYPDVFRELATLFGVDASKQPGLPPLPEFKRGCERYQREEYAQRK